MKKIFLTVLAFCLPLNVSAVAVATPSADATLVQPSYIHDVAKIKPGDTQATIQVKVPKNAILFVRATVSMDGTVMEILDPSGKQVYDTKSPHIHFLSGPQSDDGHPTLNENTIMTGGEFKTDELSLSSPGVWSLRFSFPLTKKKTFTDFISVLMSVRSEKTGVR